MKIKLCFLYQTESEKHEKRANISWGTDDDYYPDLGGASDWLKICFSYPIRSTT